MIEGICPAEIGWWPFPMVSILRNGRMSWNVFHQTNIDTVWKFHEFPTSFLQEEDRQVVNVWIYVHIYWILLISIHCDLVELNSLMFLYSAQSTHYPWRTSGSASPNWKKSGPVAWLRPRIGCRISWARRAPGGSGRMRIQDTPKKSWVLMWLLSTRSIKNTLSTIQNHVESFKSPRKEGTRFPDWKTWVDPAAGSGTSYGTLADFAPCHEVIRGIRCHWQHGWANVFSEGPSIEMVGNPLPLRWSKM